MVAETYLGPRPPGRMVRHRDEDRANCALDSLIYVRLGGRVPDNPAERGRYLVGKLEAEKS
jgi:hypothetical protein